MGKLDPATQRRPDRARHGHLRTALRELREVGVSFANPMDLKQLEYFVQVVELGRFTSAAQILRVAQPAEPAGAFA